MLSNNQLQEIRNHLNKTQNPIFFFDNDPDGLCSFLLLQRYIDKGRGVTVKSFPGLDENYFQKVEEFNADYIFVLDKPLIDKEFIDLAKKSNIPLVHIDHHDVPDSGAEYYYNTFRESGKNEPTSYLCYKVTERKEDTWIALLGCITDAFLPEFAEDIKKSNPELIDFKYKSAFDILYNTSFGKIAMIVSFAMKDSTSNLVSLLKYLKNLKSPSELLEENSKNKIILERFKFINEKYKRMLEKAEKEINKEKLFFYTYGGELSISQYLSQELFYRHQDKAIVVAYSRGNISNISLRWKKDIRSILLKILPQIEGATGGGHEHSCGARMSSDDLKKFKTLLEKEID